MVGNSLRHGRLRRLIYQQRHGRTSCHGRQRYGHVHQNEHLCAIDQHLSGHFYGIEHATSGTYLPDQRHGIQRLPDTDPTDCGIQRMVGNGLRLRRLRWGIDARWCYAPFYLLRNGNGQNGHVHLHEHL